MREDLVRRIQRTLLLVIVVGVLTAATAVWQSAREGQGADWLVRLAGPPQTLAKRYIGVVAGHSGHDSGTVCDDGLTEASVNQAVAEAVAGGLRRRGARVDVLEEFDDRLEGYDADAFVAIHVDSCQSSLSGYKVAGLAGDGAGSDRLADCLWEAYGSSTRLARNPDTITDDMRNYHAFHQVAFKTPAAIIEIGFLGTDRNLLTRGRDRVANGIVAGIECFLAPDQATAATSAK